MRQPPLSLKPAKKLSWTA